MIAINETTMNDSNGLNVSPEEAGNMEGPHTAERDDAAATWKANFMPNGDPPSLTLWGADEGMRG